MSRFQKLLGSAIRDVKGKMVIGVSGGADSTALLRGLVELRNPETLIVGHLNHGIRGERADQDAAWVEEQAQRLGVQVVLEKRAIKLEKSSGWEASARRERYRFLTETARTTGANSVAVAHTADDQVETILHHFLRGSSWRGLRGIPERRPLAEGIELIRPLLKIGRTEIEAYLTDLGESYRTDETNAGLEYTRNRIRLQLLPKAREVLGRAISGPILRIGEQARELDAYLESMVNCLVEAVQPELTKETILLQREPLLKAPALLRRAFFENLWRQQGWGQQKMGTREWQRLSDLIEKGGKTMVPGASMQVEEQFALIRRS